MNQFEKNLLTLARKLPASARPSLLDYAAFLASRSGPLGAQELNPQPRPQKESVVKAIQRLASTYPMLPKEELLRETADKVSEHVLAGKEAKIVIDELEEIFSRRYRLFLDEKK